MFELVIILIVIVIGVYLITSGKNGLGVMVIVAAVLIVRNIAIQRLDSDYTSLTS